MIADVKPVKEMELKYPFSQLRNLFFENQV
jgi:hypothetical protein